MNPNKTIFKKIDKFFEKRFFLNCRPVKIIPDLEISLYNKLSNLNYSIEELLEMEDYELLRMLQNEKNVENLFIFLRIEINKRKLDIDLKKYPAYKNFEIKRSDKAKYLEENLIN